MRIWFVIFFLVDFSIFCIECGRSGGSWGSKVKSSLGFGKQKTSSNDKSSYPKQQYGGSGVGNQGSNIGSGGFVKPGVNQGSNIGGGGFVKPGVNQGSNIGGYKAPNYSPHQYSSNIGGYSNVGSPAFNKFGYNKYSNGFGNGYYGSKYSSPGTFGGARSGFFSGSGKKMFGLGIGAGFIGGAVLAAGSMEVYHRYRQYQAMMQYRNLGYGGNGILIDHDTCLGGCPNFSFCDYGICRCVEGYDARFGSCRRDWTENYKGSSNQYDQRLKKTFNPYRACEASKDCWELDMNMLCNSTLQQCQCRRDMKWNFEGGECQIFLDVDCSSVKSSRSKRETETTSNSLLTSNETLTIVNSLQESNNSSKESFKLTANDTLIDSELLKVDLNKTNEKELTALFCKEIDSFANPEKYISETKENNNNESSVNTGTGVGVGIGVLIFILIIFCACCCFVKKCLSSVKDKLSGTNKNNEYDVPPTNLYENPADQYNNGTQDEMPMMEPIPTPGYPEVPGYAPPSNPPAYPSSNLPSYPPFPNNNMYPAPLNNNVYPPPLNNNMYPPPSNNNMYPPPSNNNMYPPTPNNNNDSYGANLSYPQSAPPYSQQSPFNSNI